MNRSKINRRNGNALKISQQLPWSQPPAPVGKGERGRPEEGARRSASRARRVPRSCAGLRGAAEPRETGVQRRVGSRDFRGLRGGWRKGDRGSPRARWRRARLPAGRGPLRNSAQMDPPKLRHPPPLLAAPKLAIYYYFLIYIFFFIFAWKRRKRSENRRVASPALPALAEEHGGPGGDAGGCGACAGATGAARSREPAPGRCEPPPATPPQPRTNTPPPLLFSFWIHAAILYPPGLSLLFFCARACCPGQQRERGLCKTGQIKMSDIILFDRMIQNDKVPSPEGARMVNS